MTNKLVLITLDGIRECDLRKNKLFKSIINKGTFLSKIIATNRLKISYPGYSELLSGIVDPMLATNLAIDNQIKTVPQILVEKGVLKLNQILLSTIWAIFVNIYSSSKSGIKPINWDMSGKSIKNKKSEMKFKHYKYKTISKKKLKEDEENMHDVRVYREFKYQYIRNRSRYLYCHLALGLTDVYGHNNNFKEYINHINMSGEIILDLLSYIDNRSYIIITTDHGRGYKNFIEHDAATMGSEHGWAILIGPTIPKNKIDATKYPLTIIANLIHSIFLD